MSDKNTKKMQRQYVRVVVWLIVVLVIAITIQILILSSFNRKNSNETSLVLLNQVVSILNENEETEDELIETLKEDYITSAQTVSYILDSKPEAEEDLDELKKIAGMMRIDEIHLFDETGKIYSGTEPKYYGYSFDSGEQMAYFKPMLKDKSLTMCQDVTPNTAEGKKMMYAITWNEAGDKMIQVGIEPVRLLEELRSNEVSEVVANMPTYDEINIWVADAESGEVLASTNTELVGSTLDEIGVTETEIDSDKAANTVVRVDGQKNYCSFMNTGEYTVVVTCSVNAGVRNILAALVIEFVYLILAGLTIGYVMKRLIRANDEKHTLFVKSNVDELTGLYNRRAYEDDIAEHKDMVNEKNFVFVSLDVNGLKTVNDSMGHIAGDELLIGAATCIKRCFGPYGKVYRIGGDEFAAMLFVKEQELLKIKRDFEDVTAHWSGEMVKKLSISCGYIKKDETNITSVHEIANMADKKMYEAKAAHYRNSSE